MGLFPTPLINGSRFSFSSVDFRIPTFPGQRITDIKSVDYTSTLEPGKVFGTSAQKVGRTRGQQECEGSVEMYREAWGLLLPALSALTAFTSGLSPLGAPPGIQEVAFDIIVSYAELPISPVQTDVLKGCRIKKIGSNAAEGTEALTVKLDLDIMQIGYTGVGQSTPVYPLNLVVI